MSKRTNRVAWGLVAGLAGVLLAVVVWGACGYYGIVGLHFSSYSVIVTSVYEWQEGDRYPSVWEKVIHRWPGQLWFASGRNDCRLIRLDRHGKVEKAVCESNLYFPWGR
jgi:hypothetical protein